MKKTNLTILLIGAIVIAITLCGFFLLEIEKTDINICALCFLIFAEAALFLGVAGGRILGKNHSKVFIRSGLYGVLAFYFIAVFVFTFTAGLFTKIATFIFLQLVLAAICAIFAVLFIYFARRIGTSDNKINTDRMFMQGCEQRIYNLLSDSKNSSYSKDLEALYENIKYSDKIGKSSADEKIASQISALEKAIQTANETNIADLLGQLNTLLTQRKAELLQSKRGGF